MRGQLGPDGGQIGFKSCRGVGIDAGLPGNGAAYFRKLLAHTLFIGARGLQRLHRYGDLALHRLDSFLMGFGALYRVLGDAVLLGQFATQPVALFSKARRFAVGIGGLLALPGELLAGCRDLCPEVLLVRLRRLQRCRCRRQLLSQIRDRGVGTVAVAGIALKQGNQPTQHIVVGVQGIGQATQFVALGACCRGLGGEARKIVLQGLYVANVFGLRSWRRGKLSRLRRSGEMDIAGER